MTSFPPPPTSAIDWAHIGFNASEVNGHVEAYYTKATGKWSLPVFVKDPYIRIHGLSPALNYGQQAFEGLKAYRTPGDGGIQVFRADKNGARLQHSAEVISVPPVPLSVFEDAVHAAVARNAEFVPPHATGASLYIRPVVYGSSAQLGLSPPDEYTLLVFVLPTGVYHGTGPVRALILDAFDRAAPHGTGHAKLGGNYAPVLRWSEWAHAEGFGITLHLDSARHEEVDEFSTSGFLGVLGTGDDVTLVAPASQCVIASVTSDSVQQLARSFGWQVEKRAIRYAELPQFSEVFAAGTAAALVPIRSITRRIDAGNPQSLAAALGTHARLRLGQGEETVVYMADSQEEAGPVCQRLRTQLQAIQRGTVADPFGWVAAVTADDVKRAGEK